MLGVNLDDRLLLDPAELFARPVECSLTNSIVDVRLVEQLSEPRNLLVGESWKAFLGMPQEVAAAGAWIAHVANRALKLPPHQSRCLCAGGVVLKIVHGDSMRIETTTPRDGSPEGLNEDCRLGASVAPADGESRVRPFSGQSQLGMDLSCWHNEGQAAWCGSATRTRQTGVQMHAQPRVWTLDREEHIEMRPLGNQMRCADHCLHWPEPSGRMHVLDRRGDQC